MLGLGLKINNVRSGSATPILSLITNPILGFSLRYLSPDNTGDVILAENSNTDQEGFTPAEITDGTLVAFANEGDGNLGIKTFYDLTGNGNHGTVSGVIRIVNSGTLVTMNGKPAFDPVDDSAYINIPVAGNAACNVFSVVSNSDTGTHCLLEGQDENKFVLVGGNGSGSTLINNEAGTPTFRKNGSSFSPSTRGDVYSGLLTQSLLQSGFDSSTWTEYNIGYSASGSIRMYKSQEVIIAHGVQSSVSEIETAINSYYSI